MKKILLLTSVVLFWGHIAMAQIKLQVIGQVTGDTEGHNMVYLHNQLAMDSARIENGKFVFNIEEQQPGSRAISLAYDRAKMRMYVPLVLYYDQSGTINVTFDIVQGLSSAKVTGLPSAATFYNYNTDRGAIFVHVNQAVKRKFGAQALQAGHADQDKATAFRDELMNRMNDSILQAYMRPDQIVSAAILMTQAAGMPLDKLTAYYTALDEAVKNSPDGKAVYARIEGRKNAQIGAMIKPFELSDQNDKVHAISEFEGKYILLDFWASWCSPCRASFPRIREVFKKLDGKNFMIINISIDKNKAAWLKAVQEENNPWPQLWDNKQVSSALFNVSAVPTSYLIDPSGKILAKEIGFDPKGGGAMEKRLEEIFNVKF